MNCCKCGSALDQNNTICPKCGFDNKNVNTTTTENDMEILDLNDEDTPEITATMAPPTLEVAQEKMRTNAGDISNTAGVSDYEVVEVEEPEEKNLTEMEKSNVDIAIPSVKTPVDSSNVPTDGSAPVIVEDKETAGVINNAPLTNPSKKKKLKINLASGSKNVPKGLMIIVAIVFLIIGVLTGKTFFSKNYCTTTTTKSTTSSVNYVSNGSNNETNVDGVTYKIPTSYIYDKSDDGLLIYSSDDTYRIYLRKETGIYADMSGAKNSIKETLKNNSMTVNNVKELKLNEREFLTFECTTKSVNRLVAFSYADDTHVFYIEIVASSNDYEYDVLDVVEDIITNATVEEATTTMESIDVYDIAEIAIKAATEYKNLTSNN